jgi:colicin import membrane protein
MKIPTRAVLIASAIALTAGCATTESVDKLQSQVNALRAATANAQQTADGAAASANSAGAAARQAQAGAERAQASADKSFGAAGAASEMAKAAESDVVNVDAKLDQMFKKLHRK